MKKVLILTLILSSISLSAQEINWMTLDEAVKAQKKAPKKIFMDAYTIWCGPCKMLDKNTFNNKDVAEYINKNYYAVKFNAEGNSKVKFKGTTYTNPKFNPDTSGRNSSHELSGVLGIRAYPTLLFLDEQANLIAPITGYKTPSQLELFLKFFNSADVKNITKESWESYAANFIPEFKD
ncbi:thioredoxin fold domain-containing protein [uncultured Lutibacter sp.]|uniref:thioredoxin family protein n=1 Tax=uncultured Lutibacter sp. TaxID=437739 RepID=UPI00261F5F59|nr:thioredoxin fold domain-containing protein [uncultured Lutibacter sp.]